MRARSELLRFHEVRDAYRLIGECRDLAACPARWQTRIAEGLSSLVGGVSAATGEGMRETHSKTVRPLTGHAFGLDDSGVRALDEFHRGPALRCPILATLAEVDDVVATDTRRALVPDDRAWYRSESYECRAAAGVDHTITSISRTVGGMFGIAIHRAKGERDFSPRERLLVHFFHSELRPLIGRSLATQHGGPSLLSPRLQQTLTCLLEGLSEKEVGVRLHLSGPTVHQYVTELYRRFGVRSRAQLMAFFIRNGRPGEIAIDRADRRAARARRLRLLR